MSITFFKSIPNKVYYLIYLLSLLFLIRLYVLRPSPAYVSSKPFKVYKDSMRYDSRRDSTTVAIRLIPKEGMVVIQDTLNNYEVESGYVDTVFVVKEREILVMPSASKGFWVGMNEVITTLIALSNLLLALIQIRSKKKKAS